LIDFRKSFFQLGERGTSESLSKAKFKCDERWKNSGELKMVPGKKWRRRSWWLGPFRPVFGRREEGRFLLRRLQAEGALGISWDFRWRLEPWKGE
jgi:hypothetical protein